ncbi:GNAT family N-acetyltransferase [Celerinatantimonas sp. YJH-8]|uniref:GNAT family N-acetyltransferase n=1 Tax=Celerinatantimonas sp. YJH-8 TaxID=3228714 RepID=UPI0038C2A954
MLQVPKIVTDNAIITILKPDRADLVLDFYSRNQDFFKPWSPIREDKFFTLPYWQQRMEQAYQQFLDDQALYFVALTPDESSIAAIANFSAIIEGAFKGCYLRFAIDKNREGQGLMQEVLCHTLNYVFCELDLHRVMANYPPTNIRAQKLLTRLGFKPEGLARSYMKINGTWQDHHLSSLTNPLHIHD